MARRGGAWVTAMAAACMALPVGAAADDREGRPREGLAVAALAADLVAAAPSRALDEDDAGAAAGWVADALATRGWVAREVGVGRLQLPAVVSCQRGGPGAKTTRLFVAHTDTVAGTVGGNDNAAGVALLVQLAADLQGVETPAAICVAFPPLEEVGLLGSAALAERWRSLGPPGPLELVVSLDLAGVGTPTWNGLGPAWDGARLRALLDAAPADVPWLYRAVSVAWPHLERSDHAPFAAQGVLAAHLMARGPLGFDPAYHTAADTPSRLDPRTLAAQLGHLRRLALAPPLPDDPTAALGRFAWVVPGTPQLLPGGVVMLGTLAALVAGTLGVWGPLSARGLLRRALLLAAGGVVAAGTLAAAGAPLAGPRAGPAVLAAWALALCAWGAGSSPAGQRGGGQLALASTVALGVACVIAGFVQLLPLLAVVAAGVGLAVYAGPCPRAWAAAPLVGAGLLYLGRPAVLRELAFHGLLADDPWVWGALITALAGPLVAVAPGRPPRFVLAALALAGLVLLTVARATTGTADGAAQLSPWPEDGHG